jgi:hypothetical protein
VGFDLAVIPYSVRKTLPLLVRERYCEYVAMEVLKASRSAGPYQWICRKSMVQLEQASRKARSHFCVATQIARCRKERARAWS